MRFGELFVRVTGAGAARLEASDRGLVRVTGADRVRFLNGMVTNDVAHLAPGELQIDFSPESMSGRCSETSGVLSLMT